MEIVINTKDLSEVWHPNLWSYPALHYNVYLIVEDQEEDGDDDEIGTGNRDLSAVNSGGKMYNDFHNWNISFYYPLRWLRHVYKCGRY